MSSDASPDTSPAPSTSSESRPETPTTVNVEKASAAYRAVHRILREVALWGSAVALGAAIVGIVAKAIGTASREVTALYRSEPGA